MSCVNIDLSKQENEVTITRGPCYVLVVIGGISIELCYDQWSALVEAVDQSEKTANAKDLVASNNPIAGERLWPGDAVYVGDDGKAYKCRPRTPSTAD